MATVGKKELATALGWTRPKLDRRLASDAKFPVISRGDQSGGWQFDVDAVRGYLGGGATLPTKATPVSAAAIDKKQLAREIAPPPPRQAVPPSTARRSAHHSGEATARQRKDEADASLKEDKLREQRGELVQRAELRQALAELMLGLGHDLDSLPERIVKACELREDAAPGIRSMIDQVRIDMVKRAEPLLTDA